MDRRDMRGPPLGAGEDDEPFRGVGSPQKDAVAGSDEDVQPRWAELRPVADPGVLAAGANDSEACPVTALRFSDRPTPRQPGRS